MKRKNTGLSTVEIVVAAVILVAVVVGLLLVVKLTKNTDGPSKEELEAKKVVEDLLNRVDGYVRAADLDVNYDEENYIRFVGSEKSQIFHFDSASGKVYMIEKNTADYGTDENVIRKMAEGDKPQNDGMQVVANHVVTFVIDLVDKDTAKGLVRTTVRAQVGNANTSDTKDTPLNGKTIEYFAKYAGHDVELPTSTPTPKPTNTPTPIPTPTTSEVTPGGDATPTPEPTQPVDTPTPTPGEKEPTVVTKLENNTTNTGSVVINTMVAYPDDAVFRVVVSRSDDEVEAKKGQVIGGIGLDVFVPADGYEFKLDSVPDKGDELTYDFTVGEFREFGKKLGVKKVCIKVNDNSGFKFECVKIIYYK